MPRRERVHEWEPVACPAEGYNAPIGHICWELFLSRSSKPCLRTLGGDVLRKKAFMEEVGLEDVSTHKLAVVRRRADGGWEQLGSLAELSRALQQGQQAAGAAAVVQVKMEAAKGAAAAPAAGVPPAPAPEARRVMRAAAAAARPAAPPPPPPDEDEVIDLVTPERAPRPAEEPGAPLAPLALFPVPAHDAAGERAAAPAPPAARAAVFLPQAPEALPRAVPPAAPAAAPAAVHVAALRPPGAAPAPAAPAARLSPAAPAPVPMAHPAAAPAPPAPPAAVFWAPGLPPAALPAIAAVPRAVAPAAPAVHLAAAAPAAAAPMGHPAAAPVVREPMGRPARPRMALAAPPAAVPVPAAVPHAVAPAAHMAHLMPAVAAPMGPPRRYLVAPPAAEPAPAAYAVRLAFDAPPAAPMKPRAAVPARPAAPVYAAAAAPPAVVPMPAAVPHAVAPAAPAARLPPAAPAPEAAVREHMAPPAQQDAAQQAQQAEVPAARVVPVPPPAAPAAVPAALPAALPAPGVAAADVAAAFLDIQIVPAARAALAAPGMAPAVWPAPPVAAPPPIPVPPPALAAAPAAQLAPAAAAMEANFMQRQLEWLHAMLPGIMRREQAAAQPQLAQPEEALQHAQPAAQPQLLSPPRWQQPPVAAELAAARLSTSRRRSLLGCPVCKSLRRGAVDPDAAAEALTCPVCFCEVEGEHTHTDCGHANECMGNYLHAAYKRGQHPECQLAACKQLMSAEDLQQGVLVLCDCQEVAEQRAQERLPPLDDPGAVYQRFNNLAAAAVARGAGGELIECQQCHFRMLAEADSPEDAVCPNCRVGRPILDAKEAAQRLVGIQNLDGGERVLYCPDCFYGPQQKSQYCNKLCCGGCKAVLCWCCGEVIGDKRAYDHFVGGGGGAGRCPLYGLPGERPVMTEEEVQEAQQRAVQREQRDQATWDRLIHPAHAAVRGMRGATPEDLQRDEALWRRVHSQVHTTLERLFNQITEAAAEGEVELPVGELREQLLEGARPALAAAWPGWDVWEGVVGDVLRAVRRSLT